MKISKSNFLEAIKSKLLSDFRIHMIFFVLRSIVYWIMIQETRNGPVFSLREIEILISFELLSLLTSYVIAKALVTHNVYDFDISICLCIHNIIVILLYETIERRIKYLANKLLLYGFMFLFGIEACYCIYIRYTKRREISVYLFKKFGADPKINGKCNLN